MSPADQAILRVLKLSMFAQGRRVKESDVRKSVMWANGDEALYPAGSKPVISAGGMSSR